MAGHEGALRHLCPYPKDACHDSSLCKVHDRASRGAGQGRQLSGGIICLSEVAVQINAGMMRALEAFQEAILMVDATDGECWRVLHVNRTFSEQTGMSTP